MQKTFDPQSVETRWYSFWEDNNFFAPSGSGEGYCIVIPPPNVTGSLHMGHAFQHTLMDALIRYERMCGKNTLWQVGTDHAGIATQMVVERKLTHEEDKTRHDLGRDAFIDKIWEWKEESGGTITRQMRRLGNSVDWSTERFTMDPGFYRAVQEVFVRLYDEGLLYRGKRLVNWDPKLHTAISDLEVENNEEQGFLWHFRYPLADGAKTADGKDYLVVATTRPETMLGDSAVAVHPKDERFADLVGKHVLLPLVNRKIPIVADDYVDREFGSGCVKITPAHDFNDNQLGARHELPMINVLDASAAILAQAQVFNSDGTANTDIDATLPADLAGLDRTDARKQVVAQFEQAGLLDKIEDHTLKVPRGDRSGLVIEPLLTDQWFVDAKTLAKPAIEAVENGDIQFVPKQYENMYFSWMRDIQDWCISRQLWWGHRIPAWYDDDGNVYVAADEAAARAKYKLDTGLSLRQDDDVLDTWFSSALWTFGTQGWPENTPQLQAFHPSSVLVSGFDIIFFWVARMIMVTLHFIKDDDGKSQVPFHTVYMTGLIRDEQGQKMSKSKGNVLDPLDMIDGISLDDLLEKRTGNMMQPQLRDKIAKRTRKQFPEGIVAHGTDALRFTLAALASTGRDINWDMNRLEGYRNFCNKLWNAARYVLMNVEGQDLGKPGVDIELSIADRWIISQLQSTSATMRTHFANYRFDLASQALYEFIWNEYCDWYLELSKPVMNDDEANERLRRGTRQTLVQVLESLLRLAHPIMPFITEEIWQTIKPYTGTTGNTIMLQPYPDEDSSKVDASAVDTIEWLKKVIVAVRNIRGEMNIPPGKKIPVYFQHGTTSDKERLEKTRATLTALARLENTSWLEAGDEPPPAATQLADHLEILVPLAGLIDKDEEIARLEKSLAKIEKEIQRLQGKLGNPKFTDKAPAEVVEKEQAKLQDAQESHDKLKAQQQQLQDL